MGDEVPDFRMYNGMGFGQITPAEAEEVARQAIDRLRRGQQARPRGASPAQPSRVPDVPIGVLVEQNGDDAVVRMYGRGGEVIRAEAGEQLQRGDITYFKSDGKLYRIDAGKPMPTSDAKGDELTSKADDLVRLVSENAALRANNRALDGLSRGLQNVGVTMRDASGALRVFGRALDVTDPAYLPGRDGPGPPARAEPASIEPINPRARRFARSDEEV